MAAAFSFAPSSLAGYRAATLPLHMTSSENLEKWQSSGRRKDLGSQDPLCPHPPPCSHRGPTSGRRPCFVVRSSVSGLWRRGFGGPVCLLPSPWHMHTGHTAPGYMFPLGVSPSLSGYHTLKYKAVEWVLWNVPIAPGVGGHTERHMMS